MATTVTSSHAADTTYLVRQSVNTGYQWASLLVPPTYITYVVARRGRAHLYVNNTLRATWLGGLAGAGGAGGIAYARYAYSTEDTVRSKRIQSLYDTNALRRNDHSTIGQILFGVLTPAILWKRASVVNLILGGASIGGAVGLLVHHGRSLSGDPPPTVVAPAHDQHGQNSYH